MIQWAELKESLALLESEKISLTSQLEESMLKTELLQKSLSEAESAKQHLSDLLKLEKQRVMKAGSEKMELKILAEHLKTELKSRTAEKKRAEKIESEMMEWKTAAANLKKDLDNQILNLTELKSALKTIQSENDILSNEMKYLVNDKSSLRMTLEKVENEKRDISENLLCEIRKNKILKVNIEELTANLSRLDLVIHCLDRDMSNLKTEMEAMREAHRKEKSDLWIHVEDVHCKLTSMKDSVREMSARSESIQNEVAGLRVDCQELQLQGTHSQQSKEEFFLSLLDQLDGIEKHVQDLEAMHKNQVSSLSQDLEIAQERLHFLVVSLQGIFVECHRIFPSVRNIDERKAEIFQGLANDCLSGSQEIFDQKVVGDMSDLILQCVNLLEEYLLNRPRILEVPLQIAEMAENQPFSTVLNPSLRSLDLSVDVSCQSSSNCRSLLSTAAEELGILSNRVREQLCSFEESFFSQKERLEFLVHHHLIEESSFESMLLTIKFFWKTFNKVKCKVPAPLTLEDFISCLLSPSQPSEEIISVLKRFCCSSSEGSGVNCFFEKCLLVNAYKNMFIVCKLKKVLCFASDKLVANFNDFRSYCRYFIARQNIHKHAFHKPVPIQSEFLIYLHRINCVYYNIKLNSDTACLTKTNEHLIDVMDTLRRVKLSKVPLVLNCLIALTEGSINAKQLVKTNQICFVMKMVELCYIRGEITYFSRKTVKKFENFLHLCSNEYKLGLNRSGFINQSNILSDLILLLLEDIMSIPACSHEELDESKILLSEKSRELSKLKSDYESSLEQLSILQSSLQDERKDHHKLSDYARKVEEDYDILLNEKQQWKEKVGELSKLCCALKIIFSDDCDIGKLQVEIATLSNSFCLCQICLTNITLQAAEVQSHTVFSPVVLIHSIAELYICKNNFEKELVRLKENDQISRKEQTELQTKMSHLQLTIKVLETTVNSLEYELENWKSKYACLEKEYQHINHLYLESNDCRENQQKFLDTNMEEIHKYKNQYKELSDEYKKIKDDFAEKVDEISNLEKMMQTEASKYEVLDKKCKNYEGEIKNLSSTIDKLNCKLESKDLINNEELKELKNRIESLKKSNNLLNVTLETVEEELQNVYKVKQNLEENLQEKLETIEKLQQEIVLFKGKMMEQSDEISNLQLIGKELEFAIEDARNKYSENCKLKEECQEKLEKIQTLQLELTLLKSKDIEKSNEISKLQCVIKELEKENCSLQNNLRSLEQNILRITDEKKNLEMKLKEIKANTSQELQDKNKLLADLENKLKFFSKEKVRLEEHMSNLLLSEKKIKKEKENLGLECNELAAEKSLLKLKIAELQVSNAKAVNSNEQLTSKNEKCVKEWDSLRQNLKKEISVIKKSNLENAMLIQHLQTKLKVKTEKLQSAEEKAYRLEFENSDLMKQLSVLKSLSPSLCKCQENSSLLRLKDEKLEDYRKCLAKVINSLATVIQDREYGNDLDKSDLIALLSSWESNIKNLPDFASQMASKVQSVLNYRLGKQKLIETKLHCVLDLVCQYVSELQRYCDSEKCKFDLNSMVRAGKDCFEESICIFPEEAEPHFLFNSFISELESNLKVLILCFDSLKDIIVARDAEIVSLKDKIASKKVQSLENAEATIKQCAECQTMKNKCHLLLQNSYRLEKNYLKLQKFNEELEACIKTLQREKEELNAEADEMAEIIRSNSSV